MGAARQSRQGDNRWRVARRQAKNLEWGRKIVEMRAANTVAAIKKAIADRRK